MNACVRVMGGTGASYGQWEVIWSEREIADLGEIVDWIIAQPGQTQGRRLRRLIVLNLFWL